MTYSFQTIHTAVLPVMTEAGGYLRQLFQENLSLETKGGIQLSTAVVTRADREIENLIKAKLTELFPKIGFIGEESPLEEIQEYNWILDPIDGTLNFGSHLPLYGISLALWKDNEPLYAIIAFPELDEIVWAGKGKGLFLNGTRVRVDHFPTEKPTVLYSHVGADKDKLKILGGMIKNGFSLPRYFASTVFSGASIALRKAHAIICLNNGLWDIAAVYLCIQEAGLTCAWLSTKPQLKKKYQLKEYRWSLIMGDKKTVTQLKKVIKPLL